MAGNTGVEEGVGRTALMVAAARAIETHRHDALARDAYAEHTVTRPKDGHGHGHGNPIRPYGPGLPKLSRACRL
jgi:hypothetical protein